MPDLGEDLVTNGGLTLPASAITWRFSRGTGPGGQGVNTTDSRVELLAELASLEAAGDAGERVRQRLGDVTRVVVATERSQLRNRELALERLAARLDAAAHRDPPRRPTRPSGASVRRRLETKREQSQRKAHRRLPAPED